MTGGPSGIGAGQVNSFWGTPQLKKKETSEKKEPTTVAKGEEKGSQVMDALAMLGATNQIAPKKTPTFDIAALTARAGELDQSTKDGLTALSNPQTLAMFNAFSGQLKGPDAQQLDAQNAFLKEFA